jgi:hypothetical protein
MANCERAARRILLLGIP